MTVMPVEPLVVPGTLDALESIAEYVMLAAEQAGLERKAAYRLRLAVDEIATNIVLHGYDEAGLKGDVRVTAELTPESLTITIEDDAVPYDPLSAAPPVDLEMPLEKRSIGGLGIFLTLRGVDDFRYERVSDRNRNIFVMRLGKPAAEAPAEAEAPAGDGPTVLVLGGSAGDMAALLRPLNYRVRTARNIEATATAISEGGVQLLLVSDSVKPGEVRALLNGFDGLAIENCPAVLAFVEDPTKLDGAHALLDSGVPDYLAPPYDAPLLRARLNAALDRKRLNEHQEDARKRAALLLIERDVQIGRDIQLSFLPPNLPQPLGWELSAFFRPAREVAGDFYDAFELINKRRVGFIIADVCDKGVGAALFMALFRTLLRSGAQQNVNLSWMDPGSSITDNSEWLRGDPSKRRQSLPSIGTGPLMNAIAGTNRYMTENHGMTGYFATTFFGILDPSSGNVIYINAGHNPPVVLRTNGEHELLKPCGPAVGMLPDAEYTIQQTRLGPGDMLFAYTDGVTDAKNPDGKFFTEKRLFSLLDGPSASADAGIERVRRELLDHIATAAQFDDITMMCIRRDAAEYE